MNCFVSVVKSRDSGYKVFHEPQANGNLGDVVFAAFVRKKNQPTTPLEGAKIVKVGQLELNVVQSLLQLYDHPTKSGSADSQALYLGYFLKEGIEQGMLLQYLPPSTHTSVHSHNYTETYILLSGLVKLFQLPENAQEGQFAKEIKIGSQEHKRRIITTPENHYHPLVALEPSLILIVARYDVVYDQVHGTRTNHNKTIPFAEFTSRFIAPPSIEKQKGTSAKV